MPQRPVDCVSLEDLESFSSSISYVNQMGLNTGIEHLASWIPMVPEQRLSKHVAGEMWISFVSGIILASGEIWIVIRNDANLFKLMKESVFVAMRKRRSFLDNWNIKGRIVPNSHGLIEGAATLRRLLLE